MSENTNTLFWVITGAVIVIAIFSIVSFSNNTTLSNIFNRFDGYFNKNGSTVNQNQSYVFGDWQLDLNAEPDNGLNIIITNISNQTKQNINGITLYVYEKNTKNYIASFDFEVGGDMNPNDSTRVYTSLWSDFDYHHKEYDYEISIGLNENPMYNYNGQLVSYIKDFGNWEFSIVDYKSTHLKCILINKSNSNVSFDRVDIFMYKDGEEYTHLEFGPDQDSYNPHDDLTWHSYFSELLNFNETDYSFNVIFDMET